VFRKAYICTSYWVLTSAFCIIKIKYHAMKMQGGNKGLYPYVGLLLFIQLRTAVFKAYCAIWVRRSNFRHQASPRVSPRGSTQRPKVKLWARNVRKFCLNADFNVTFRDRLHAVQLRHGTDGSTSPPKEGVLRTFFALKIRRHRAGCEPANLGTKGQHPTSIDHRSLYT
jgi:hypothetical protein